MKKLGFMYCKWQTKNGNCCQIEECGTYVASDTSPICQCFPQGTKVSSHTDIQIKI